MRTFRNSLATMLLLGGSCLAANAVTVYSASAYSYVNYGALPTGVTAVGAQGSPIALTANPGNILYAYATATNNGGGGSTHANSDSSIGGMVDNTVLHSDSTSDSGKWNVKFTNSTSSAKTLSFDWHWFAAAGATVAVGDSAFAYADAWLAYTGGGLLHSAGVFDTGYDTSSSVDSFTLVIPAKGTAFINVRSDTGGSADTSAVPEPGTVTLMIGAGISAAALLKRRRK